jgi:hypothetical protein
MIAPEAVRMDLRIGLLASFPERREKLLALLVALENALALIPPGSSRLSRRRVPPSRPAVALAKVEALPRADDTSRRDTGFAACEAWSPHTSFRRLRQPKNNPNYWLIPFVWMAALVSAM